MGQPPPTTDPLVALFANAPNRTNMVLVFPPIKIKSARDWLYPCVLSENFAAGYAEARQERGLVPERPDHEIWMAVHLRWGDIGPEGTFGDPSSTVDHPQGRWAGRIVPLTALIELTLQVKQLLSVSRKLVVQFFSEIDEAQVDPFISAVPETRFQGRASAAETLDLWSQCEVSLGARSSQFFNVGSHLAPRSIVLDATGVIYGKPIAGPVSVPSNRHPIVFAGPDGKILDSAWQRAAALVLHA